MSGLKAFLAVISTGLLISLIFYLYYANTNITGFVLAKTIPRYPNSTVWRIGGGFNFEGGYHYEDLYFETKDKAEYVLKFYKSELAKDGWEFEKDYIDSGGHGTTLKKQLGETIFTANVVKYQSFFNKNNVGGLIEIRYGK